VKNLVLVPEMATARARGLKDVTRRLNTNVKPGDVVYHGEILECSELGSFALYRRDDVRVVDVTGTDRLWSWKLRVLPSRMCPERCARLFSMIRSVREERLQDITEADAKREGVERHWCGTPKFSHVGCCGYLPAFFFLWNRLHKESPWSSNPQLSRIELGPNLTRDEAVRLAGIRDVEERLEAGKVAA
jgi:hypothetical protein